MAILVLNCGSSSVKYRLFRIRLEDVFAHGIVSSIGSTSPLLVHQQEGSEELTEQVTAPDHVQAIDLILKKLTAPKKGILKSKNEIQIVGHRVVHGGNRFSCSVRITPETRQGIQDCFGLAPLHNPHNMEGIRALEKLLPGIMQIAVFDTAFHQSIPPHAYTYGIPGKLAQKHHIRRYGFHGTSHRYVAQKAAEMLGVGFEKVKIITCHLGNGCSMTAVDRGRSIDTSMGFTPLEGLLMGTRCGDIDPAIPLFLIHSAGMNAQDVEHALNNESGLKGISGISNDMQVILDRAASGSADAQKAVDIFCYRVKKYIASYIGVLNGADAIVFTAGIGENAPLIRKQCCRNMENIGIHIDNNAPDHPPNEQFCMSTDSSPIKVFVIPTNEELLIAREAKLFLDNMSVNKL